DLLGALRVVDDVFLISGERVDPDYYVELLRPFGARYLAVTADDPFLAEKSAAMAQIGVKVVVVTPRIENYSTTRLVRLLGLSCWASPERASSAGGSRAIVSSG